MDKHRQQIQVCSHYRINHTSKVNSSLPPHWPGVWAEPSQMLPIGGGAHSLLWVCLGPLARNEWIQSVMTTELKAWVFLAASFLLLLCICGLAMVGLLTRPTRWSERV